MKRNHKSTLIMTFVASLAFLAGCSELSDNKIEEAVNKNVEKAVNKSIEEVNNTISNTVQDATLDWFDETKQDGASKTLSASQEIGSATTLLLHNEVGNIEVKAASDDRITLSTTIWANKSSSRKDDIQAIMDNAETEIIADGDQLKIVTRPKDEPEQNMWDWAQDQYGYSELFIEYVVELPESVKRYEISSNVGDIRLNNLEGNYNVRNEVGSITIEGAHIVGESRVKSETGSLQLGIAHMDSNSSFNAATEFGSINAILADSLECNLETVTELGQVNGAELGESKRNGGGPNLTLTTSIGAITVE